MINKCIKFEPLIFSSTSTFQENILLSIKTHLYSTSLFSYKLNLKVDIEFSNYFDKMKLFLFIILTFIPLSFGYSEDFKVMMRELEKWRETMRRESQIRQNKIRNLQFMDESIFNSTLGIKKIKFKEGKKLVEVIGKL